MKKGYWKLVDEIAEWESNTFSAEGSEITRPEAERVADRIIEILMDRVDGGMIDRALAEIREGDGENS